MYLNKEIYVKMTKYFITVDQVSINIPINMMGGMNTALQLDKELKLSEIFGGSDKAKALNYCSEAISYYDNKIKIMWSDRKKTA